MSVSKFTQPNFITQDPINYKASLDGAIQVLATIGAGFAPRANDTPNMKVRIDAGAIFDRSSGTFNAVASQETLTITAPGSNGKIVRVYITEDGILGTIEGDTSATPIAPSYPTGVSPLAKVTILSTTTSITNSTDSSTQSSITDERAWNTGYGTPRNTFLIGSSQTFTVPSNVYFMRISMAGAGGGGGGGASGATDTNKYGAGGGGGGAGVLNRLFNPENLTIVIGAGGTGGYSATVINATTGRTNATAGGSTSITGVSSGLSISCNGGALGAAAGVAANGAGGAGGTAGTGVAGAAGTTGVTNTSGGTGGATAGATTGGGAAAGGAGGLLTNPTRAGSSGIRGSGGGGAIGYTPTGLDSGGNGGNGWVLIEVF